MINHKEQLDKEFKDYCEKALHHCDDITFHTKLIKDFINQFYIPKKEVEGLISDENIKWYIGNYTVKKEDIENLIKKYANKNI